MSQSSDGSDVSEYEGGPLSPEPEPEPTVTLAKIFMPTGNGQILGWDGKVPKPNFKLFVRANIGYTTYNSYMPNKYRHFHINRDYNNFDSMHAYQEGVSYLHNEYGSIILPLMEGVHHDTVPLQSNCRIYKDNDTDTFWYKLNKDGYGADTEVSTNVSDSIRHIPISEIGNPCSIGKKYTPFCGYIPGRCLFLFKRECNQTYNKHKPLKREIREASLSSLPISKRPRIREGGKTRRKCKVKKRRNRRRRNTMKRRKTTAKRRHR
jgi:hypothetical protein